MSKALPAHAEPVAARADPGSVLTINGGSSSIRFALYDVGELVRQLLAGKVDRVGLSGTTLTSTDAAGQSQEGRSIHHKSPYAELAARPIKALSSDQVADLQAVAVWACRCAPS